MESGAPKAGAPPAAPMERRRQAAIPPWRAAERAPNLAQAARSGRKLIRQVYRRVRGSAGATVLRLFDGGGAERSLYLQVFTEAPVAIALLDDALKIADANAELLAMLGRTAPDLRGQPVEVLASPPHPPRLALMARKALQGSGPVEVRHRYHRADGEEGWARTFMRRIDSPAPNVALVCVIQDFTNDQTALEEQRREAERDPLTGLLNRRGGDRRLRAALEKMARTGPVAVIVCDADRFKEVNDRFGHAAGDELLAGMAGRLRAAVRATDEVARMGGDEFIVVARVADEEEAVAIADRCVRTASGPFRLSGTGTQPEQVTLSAGVAIAYPGGPVEPGSLLAAADRALYAAKADGGGGWKLAQPD